MLTSVLMPKRHPSKGETGTYRYGQAGYPEVERLIDTEDFDEINTEFEAAYSELYDITKKKRSFKTQRDARKVMRSLELTMDLFRELLAIKYRIQDEMSRRKGRDT